MVYLYNKRNIKTQLNKCSTFNQLLILIIMAWTDIFDTLASLTKGETHEYYSKGKKKSVYLKEGPASSGRKGKTIAWTGFFKKDK